jgi:L-ribulose-5-phosphate 3-epimerase
MTGRIAVCSWSLRPRSPEHLCDLLESTGIRRVQLALDPIRSDWGPNRTVRVLAARGITIVSGMMAMQGEDYSTLDAIRATGGLRPDATWPANLAAAAENAKLARTLGIRLVTFHAGFLPHDSRDPERPTMLDRLRRIRDTFAAADISIALETGQESAATLLCLLEELPGVGVNFDPANMILYGIGDPVAALRTLAPRVAQIHIKDARPTATPGQWGTETPAGEGAVNWPEFFRALGDHHVSAELVIERESGDARVADILRARDLIIRLLGTVSP